MTRDEVEILTDEYGVSHIYGDELYDLGYGNGYVQARDRLFEMDVLRHVGRGDSASVIGASQMPSDIHVRRDLYTEDQLSEQLASADEPIPTVLEGFADGVNRRMDEMGRTGKPAEFRALGHSPEPWEPEDSVAIINYLIGYFGVDGGEELANARVFAELVDNLGSREAAYEAYGDMNWLRVPEDHTVTIPREDLTVDGEEDLPSFDDVPDAQLELAEAAGDARPWGIERDVAFPRDVADGIRRGLGVTATFKWGSNALVVDGDHTTTDRPMMFGGPQMGYFKPPIIHEVGLHGADFDVTGIGVVGTPSVVIGRTPEFAWSVTSGYDDQVDTIAVELDPDDRHRFKWDGEWHEMETWTVEHDSSLLGGIVEGGPLKRSVTQEVARIRVDGLDMPVIAWNPEEDIAWCQRVTTRSDELRGVLGWAQIGREDGLDGVRDRLEDFPFTFNFHYADEDQVAFIHTCKVPDRNDDLDHRLPAPAEMHEWHDVREGRDVGIEDTDPSTGYYCNWNNAPVADWRCGDAERRWGSIHRVDLLDRFVQERLEVERNEEGRPRPTRDLALEDLEAILRDAATHDPVARHSSPYFVDAAREADDEVLDAMADELERWGDDDYVWVDYDHDEKYDHPGMAIWEETRLAIEEQVFRPKLGDATWVPDYDPPEEADMSKPRRQHDDPHAGDHGRARTEVVLHDALRGATDHDWFDGDRDSALRDAMRTAAETLEDRYGTDDPSRWFRETVHTRTGFMAMGASEPDDMPMMNRGSWNQVVALGEDLEESKGVLPPGNSGHVSLHELVPTALGHGPDRLTDQLDLYRRFDYKPLPVERDDVERVAVDDERIRTE